MPFSAFKEGDSLTLSGFGISANIADMIVNAMLQETRHLSTKKINVFVIGLNALGPRKVSYFFLNVINFY